ncbi:MAG: Two-component transcriptional response regulator, LuxR family [Nitrospira sp.]|nr:Two-component transcriptional response regulator, LuxR family [Nitrospira sp.]
MSNVSTMVPSLTLVIISNQYFGWLGLQKIFESVEEVRIAVQLHLRMSPAVLLAERQPDVFILDMESEQDPIGTMRQMRESAPTSKIVLLSGFADTDRTREAFEYGVDGVILKIQPAAVVLAVIKALYSPAYNPAPVGSCDAVSMDLRATTGQDADPDAQSSVWPDGLTERKREIIRLVGQGLSNKDIADRLCISNSTVRHHLTGIFDKIGVPNRQKLLIHTHRVHSVPDRTLLDELYRG